MPDPKKTHGRPMAATRIDVDADATARRIASERGITRSELYREILHRELLDPSKAQPVGDSE